MIRVVHYVAEDGTDYMPLKEHRADRYLQTPEDIAAYLNAAIEEFDGDPRLLMKAFRNVAAAQGGVSEIARRADIDRVGLSRSLSGRRDPRLGTVTKIASACGVKLQFVG
jgi:probable addiction module antidote protein